MSAASSIDSVVSRRRRAGALGASALLCVLGALGALGGCASPPIHYYTLVAPAGAGTTTPPAAASAPPSVATAGSPAMSASAAAPDFAFTLAAIRVPARADRASLVLSNATGQVTVLENDQWVASLADELRGAFSAALTRRLGAPDVSAIPHGAPPQLVSLTIDVQRFDLEDGRATRLDAIWSAQRPNQRGSGPLTCSVQQTESVSGPGPAALVQAQQHAIDAVATRIAATIRAVQTGQAPRCDNN